MSSSRTPKISTPRTPKQANAEERKGLLNTRENDHDDSDSINSFSEDVSDSKSWSKRKITLVAAAVIGLLITGTLTRTALFGNPIRMQQHAQKSEFSGDVLRSNGTESFKRTVIIVSIDGLRYMPSHFWRLRITKICLQSGLPRPGANAPPTKS